MTMLARASSNRKRQARPLSRQRGCSTWTNPQLSDSKQNLVLDLRCGLTPRQTGRLTVGHKITFSGTCWELVSCGHELIEGLQLLASFETVASWLEYEYRSWGIYIIWIRYQATTGEGIEDLMSAVVRSWMRVLVISL
jgi:hypothetical protein